MKPLRKVLVTWIDAVTSHGWESAAAAAGDSASEKCESIGYLLRQNKEEIVLAQTVSGNDINGRITIPKVWIIGKLRTLK